MEFCTEQDNYNDMLSAKFPKVHKVYMDVIDKRDSKTEFFTLQQPTELAILNARFMAIDNFILFHPKCQNVIDT